MAVVIGKETQIIGNEQGKRTVPSIVVIEGGDIIVGVGAKEYLLQDNKNVIYSVKRLMGAKEKIKIDGKEFSPEEISAKILSYIKK